jgi:hypothetical protein
MRGGSSSNRFVRGFVGIRSHIIRLLSHWGCQRLHGHSQTLSTSQREEEEEPLLSGASRSVEGSVKHSRTQEILCSCREGDADETIVSRNYCHGGTETRQRHRDLGSRPHTK